MRFSLKNDSFDEDPYVAQLHGFAGNLAPPLCQIKLAHILAGDTCTPIGFVPFSRLRSVEWDILSPRDELRGRQPSLPRHLCCGSILDI